MQRHRGPLRWLGYAVLAFLVAGTLLAGAVTLAVEGRDSTFNPWVVGFGGSLLFVVCAGQTGLAARALWRSWQLRLFGERTWVVLTAKEYKLDEDNTQFWTAHVAGADFRHTIGTGLYDPGPVGGRILVRRHAPSDQVDLVPRSAVAALLGDLMLPVILLVLAAFTAAIGYGLVRGAMIVFG